MSEESRPVEHRRRLLESVSDLPAYWEQTRARMRREQKARYMDALWQRLNRLVRIEEELGDDQKGANWLSATR